MSILLSQWLEFSDIANDSRFGIYPDTKTICAFASDLNIKPYFMAVNFYRGVFCKNTANGNEYQYIFISADDNGNQCYRHFETGWTITIFND